MLTSIFLFCLAATNIALGSPVSSDNDEGVPDLKWYKPYYVEVEKYTVVAGVVENMKVWHTSLRSRVDYHEGETKTIIYSSKESSTDYGVHYEIHPETTYDGKDDIVCRKMNYSLEKREDPFDVLPKPYFFYKFGTNDTFRGQECMKFKNYNSNEPLNFKLTLWAYYNQTKEIWVPLRYIKLYYSAEIGSLKEHYIFDFYNFKTEFDESETFDDSIQDCIQNTMNDEAVTKHLHFIDPDNEKHVDHVFTAFKNKHNKDYNDNDKEYALRRKIFQDNMRLIVATNRQNLGYRLAVNQFSDRTQEEMKHMRGLIRRKPGEVGTETFPYTQKDIDDALDNLPREYDARNEGQVSPVNNQLDCGSCWIFSTTAVAEGALARITGQLIRLSSKALLDCSWNYGTYGCRGGVISNAYKWMMDFGMPTEAEYGSYYSKESYCEIHNMTKTYHIRGFVDITPYSVGAIKVALVNHGPVSVVISVSDNFFYYSGGIFYDPTCSQLELTHAVVVVGYGDHNGEPYWILKNSWGQEWGVDGYMLISARHNICGVMTLPNYVIV